ncbi:MAG TPA: nuclear transport factor 2 family protein [Pyrinomonadaceae bacterium]|nr:nuclear transport factor 2 family protein [Pyrinomonadaceae bacterium]
MKYILATAVLIITVSTFAFGQCSDAEKKALEAFDLAWEAAGQRGDRAYLESTFADDFVALPAMTNKTQTIDNILRRAERNKANPQTADMVISDNYIISCTPTTATITHRLLVTVKNSAGREETFYNRSVHVLEKRGGRWQAVTNANHEVSDYAVLDYMKRDWNNALIKRDTAWFERNYAADASEIDGKAGAINDKTKAIAMMKADKSAFESAELSETDVRIEGGTAIVTGVNRLKGRDEKNQPFDIRVRFTDTFVKRDGRWQIWATQATRIP